MNDNQIWHWYQIEKIIIYFSINIIYFKNDFTIISSWLSGTDSRTQISRFRSDKFDCCKLQVSIAKQNYGSGNRFYIYNEIIDTF